MSAPNPSKAGRGICKGCGAAIIWIKNERGKPEPFDAKPTRVLHLEGDKQIDPRVTFTVGNFPLEPWAGQDWELDVAHLPHFVSCPVADRFRKPKEPRP
jgi:hypothetical protein